MYNVLKQALSDSNVNFIDKGNPPPKKKTVGSQLSFILKQHL